MLEQQQAFLRQGSAGRSPQGLLRAGERAAGGEAHCQAGACWGRSKAYLLCLSWASACLGKKRQKRNRSVRKAELLTGTEGGSPCPASSPFPVLHRICSPVLLGHFRACHPPGRARMSNTSRCRRSALPAVGPVFDYHQLRVAAASALRM